MTDHEMRIRLAEAMRWTDLEPVSQCGRMHGLWGTEPAGWFAPGSRARTGIIAPNPLESDSDAARLRAWCVGQGWNVTVCHHIVDCRCAVWPRGVPLYGFKGILGLSAVRIDEESDHCSRERRVTCEAVIQALDTIEAGGGA